MVDEDTKSTCVQLQGQANHNPNSLLYFYFILSNMNIFVRLVLSNDTP
jgi:hypothetical protein